MIPESCPLNDKYKLWAKLHQECISKGFAINGEIICKDCHYYKMNHPAEVNYKNIKKRMEEMMKDRGIPFIPSPLYTPPKDK